MAVSAPAGGVRPGAGRPATEVAEWVLRDIVRLHGRGSSKAIAAKVGVSERIVRRVWEAAGLRAPKARRAWTADEDAHLVEHAGEQNVARLARELRRTEAAIRWRLGVLGLSVEELRGDLTVAQVAETIGRSEEWVRRRIERREVPARRQDGAWRLWPRVVRDWVRRDPFIVDWARVGDAGPYLVTLLAGDQ